MSVPANSSTDSATKSPEALEIWRRKLGFRAWHRGTREADLLVGSFAERHLPGFDAVALRQFELLMKENDPDIYEWMTGRTPVPPEHDNPVTVLLRAFRLPPASS